MIYTLLVANHPMAKFTFSKKSQDKFDDRKSYITADFIARNKKCRNKLKCLNKWYYIGIPLMPLKITTVVKL